MAFTKEGSYVLQAWEVKGSPWQWSLTSLGGLGFSLDFLSWVTLAPSDYLQGSQPQYSCRCLTPKAWTSTPCPHLPWRACKLLLGWEVLFNNYLCGEFFLFCLPSTCFCIPLWGSSAPLHALSWGGFWVYGNFSSFMTPSLGHRSPHQNSLSLFFIFIICPASFWSLACLFRSLGSSASVQKVFRGSCSTCRYIFDVVRSKVISLSYSSTIFNGSPHLQQFPSSSTVPLIFNSSPSTFLCMGRCKSLDSLKPYVWYAPQLSGASVFTSWVSSGLIVGSGCSLMVARWQIFSSFLSSLRAYQLTICGGCNC